MGYGAATVTCVNVNPFFPAAAKKNLAVLFWWYFSDESFEGEVFSTGLDL